MMNRFIGFCLLLVFTGFPSLTKAQNPDLSAINLLPRYGYAPKTSAHLAADQAFITDATRQNGGDQAAAAVAVINLGWRYFYQENLPTAIKRFNQAWLLDSANAGVYFGFSAYLEQRNDTAGARLYRQLGRKYDINRQGELTYYSRLADFHDKKHDHRRVIDDYQQLLAITPRYPGAYGVIGYNYMELKDTTQAVRYLDRALAENPRDSVAFNNKGWLYYQHKRYPQAIANFTRAVAVAPNYISAYNNRALAQLETGDYQAALADYEQCLALVPVTKRGQFHVQIGRTKLLMQDRPGACAAFRLALALKDPAIDEKALRALYERNCK